MGGQGFGEGFEFGGEEGLELFRDEVAGDGAEENGGGCGGGHGGDHGICGGQVEVFAAECHHFWLDFEGFSRVYQLNLFFFYSVVFDGGGGGGSRRTFPAFLISWRGRHFFLYFCFS